jgi:hypothetical protein
MADAAPPLDRIVRHMILRSFPRLRRPPITISWGLEDGLLDYVEEPLHHSIRVNECLRVAPRRVLEGGIAHELCHIDAGLRTGPFQRQLAWQRYFASRWSRTREERLTEHRVIQLGYGRQLLAFLHYARRLGHSFSREHGLLEPEIRRALAAISSPAPRSASR